MASETFILNQVIGLIRRGHEVDVYTWPGADLSVLSPEVRVRVNCWPARPRFWPDRLLRLLKLCLEAGPEVWGAVLRSLNFRRYGVSARSLALAYQATVTTGKPAYDAILGHFGRTGRELQMLRETGAILGPLVTVFHGYDLSSYLREQGERVYDRLLAEGDLFLPVSNYWARKLVALGAESSRVVVHRMGVDCRWLRVCASRPGSGDCLRLLSVGRLVEKKGFEDGIRAVARVLERAKGSLEYRILGEGPQRIGLERLTDELGAGDSIRLLGWRSPAEVAEVMAQSDLLLVPSRTATDGDMEGIPVVLMEAMSRGLPAIGTRHSGIPEIIDEGVSGYLVEEGDVEALSSAIESLISQRDRLPAMGRAARAKIESEYNLERLNDRLVELLSGLEESGPV